MTFMEQANQEQSPAQPPSKIDAMLQLNYYSQSEPWLTSQRTLRRLIGILGMALPIMLVVVTTLDVNYFYPLDSISHYYFTRANSVFIGVVSLMAIFLLIYKGMEPADFYLSSLAALGALLLVLFPTNNITDVCPHPEKTYSTTVIRVSEFRVLFHYACAGVFLSCLAFMSIFLFTKSKETREQRRKEKKTRNTIYVVCGVFMIIALLVIFVGGFLEVIPPPIYEKLQLTFWMEVLAIEAFGFSWLIKGETLFTDKTTTTSDTQSSTPST